MLLNPLLIAPCTSFLWEQLSEEFREHIAGHRAPIVFGRAQVANRHNLAGNHLPRLLNQAGCELGTGEQTFGLGRADNGRRNTADADADRFTAGPTEESCAPADELSAGWVW